MSKASTAPKLGRSDHAKLTAEENVYVLKSDKLDYRNNKIYYSNYPQKPVSLDKFYIPVSDSSPKLKALSDNPKYVSTALAFCDLKIRRSKNNNPDKYALNKAITAYFNVMLFLRSRNIYYLKDAGHQDMRDLIKSYAEKGWKTVLNTDEKVSEVISNLNQETFRESVNFKRSSFNLFDSLSADFWRKHVGFKPKLFLTERTKSEFEEKAHELGFYTTESWNKSFSGEERTPSNVRVRSLMSHINHLYYLPNSVDKLTFLAFEKTKFESSKVAHKISNRTANLGIEEASHILGQSMNWIYNHGPKLVDILNSTREEFRTGTIDFRKNFLRENNPFYDLAEDLGIPVPNVWMKKTSHSACQDYYLPVDKLIGALQGACAVAIAGFNARRSSEVCDRNIGLREVDLVLDPEGGFHRVNFYIEKSYQEKHLFYVNKVTVDAITMLAKLKASCEPILESLSESRSSDSLFTCHFWTTYYGPKTPNDFIFSRARNQPRSLGAFLSFLDDEFKGIDLKSHMWRRFFGLIYIYRYDHSNLQSLSQHLRHMWISQTLIYVTDTSARKHNEDIASKVQNIKGEKILDVELMHSLYEESRELDEVIQLVQKEKFMETVKSILSAENYSGGFPRLIRKLYKSFSRELNFSQLTELEKSGEIATTLLKREYNCNPMSHGQCNAPINNHTFGAKCSKDGILEKEKASASFCQRCMYHSKSDNYIKNLRQEISLIEEEILSNDTPIYFKENAINARKSLVEVIKIHEESATKNAKLMQNLVMKNET